jgi:predicted lactoylglutathione lyase
MEIIKKIEDWLLLMYSYILPIQKRLFIMLLGEERYSSLTFRNIKKLA